MQNAPKLPVPVFPLPDTVLFPGTQLPLHVFELRYRTMVREALSGERLIALALLKAGWEQDYHGSPEFHPLGCLARFEDVVWLPNDCYDLRVKGLVRVRFKSVVREFPYRSVRVEPLPQHPHAEDDPLVEMDRSDLATSFQRMLEAHGVPPASAPIHSDMGYETLVNTICTTIDLRPVERLEMLALDSVIERGRRVRDLLERRLERAHPAPPPLRLPGWKPPAHGTPEQGGERN